MGMLEEAQIWLEEQRHQNMTVPAAYQRGGGETVEMQATLGKSIFKSEDDYGRLIRTVTTDFLVRAQDLVIGGEETTPQPGDCIFYPRASETNSKVGVYEVTGISGEPCWRYSDINNKTIRIHTKGSL